MQVFTCYWVIVAILLLPQLYSSLILVYYYLISNLDLVRTIGKDLRFTLLQLCRIELMNLQAKAAIAQINCLLQYYRRETNLGQH